MFDRKARVGAIARQPVAYRRRVPIHREHVAVPTEPREDRTGVTATPVRCVEVATVGPNRQRRDRGVEQHGAVRC